MLGKLYVVSTPIGNIADITYHAVQLLQTTDIICCEDVRECMQLLSQILPSKQFAIYAYNQYQKVLGNLQEGKNVILLSDRGTPCISDPGYELITLCIENNINITVAPGACAVTALVSISGFGGRFFFYGFLPKTGIDKILTQLHYIYEMNVGIVFFESPYRIKKVLALMCEKWSNGKICIGRELTKKFETIYRHNLNNADFINELNEKGEYTFMIVKSN